MIKNTEKLTQAASKTIDSANTFAIAALETFEKLTKLQLESSRRVLEETALACKEISTIKNPKDLLTSVNKFAAQTFENNMANYREAYDVMSNSQSKLGKFFETHLQSAQENMISAVAEMSQYTPAKGKVSADSLKSWVDNANSAFKAMNSVVDQVTEMTTKNVSAATEATMNAMKKSSAKK